MNPVRQAPLASSYGIVEEWGGGAIVVSRTPQCCSCPLPDTLVLPAHNAPVPSRRHLL